jgi:recombination protein RecA
MLRVKSGQALPIEELIPSPSFGLNHVLGGGFLTGRFHVLWGNPSAGKTTLSLHAMAEAQKMGYTPVIIDAEGSYTDAWAERCGIDIANREYIRSTIVEDVLKEIIPMMDSDNKYLFLLDSVNALIVEGFYDKADGGKAIGIKARSQGYLFLKMANYLKPNNGVICIAQQSIKFSGQNAYTAINIGNAVDHWATNIVHLFGSSSKDNVVRGGSELITERNVSWTIDKSKQRPIQGISGNYWFSPQVAYINTKREAVEIAVSNGLIQKNGPAWFVWDGQKYNGMAKLLDGITAADTEKILQQLKDMELVFEGAVEEGGL